MNILDKQGSQEIFFIEKFNRQTVISKFNHHTNFSAVKANLRQPFNSCEQVTSNTLKQEENVQKQRMLR
jgi:hypothetical protein